MTERRWSGCSSISISMPTRRHRHGSCWISTRRTVHGTQEGRFYHGYYKSYCYLPLYITCGHHLLAAKLRPANIDGAAGAREEVARIVAQIRERWPLVEIVLRADSGFAASSPVSSRSRRWTSPRRCPGRQLIGAVAGADISSSNFGPFSDFSSDGCFDSGSRLCFRGWPWRVVVVRF